MSARRARRWLLPVAVVALLAVLVTGVSVAAAGASALVVGGRSPESVDVSGSRVVYADRRDGAAGVFLYDDVDGSTTRITDTSVSALQPSVSGSLVAYTRWSAGYADICLYDAAAGSTRVISSAADNQVSPSVSSDWLVWEDHRTSYSPQIWAYDLDTGIAVKVDSGYNLPKRRPRVAGNIVVWQDYAGQPSGRFDSDVKAYDLVAKRFITVANSTRSEIVPETDGRYIVWAEEASAGDLNIRAYDTVTKAYTDVCSDPGEQTYPVISGGSVYWVDASAGAPHIDTRPVAGGAAHVYDTYATGSVTALAARDGGVAWLQQEGSRWRVRASLPDSGPLAALARLVEPLADWRTVSLARIAANDDDTQPQVLATSVQPGAVQVEDDSFTAYFSEPLDSDTVSGSSVSLVAEATGDPVSARVTYSSLSRSVRVAPQETLDGTYRLTFGSEISDRAGNTLAAPAEVTFATGMELAELTAPIPPDKVIARPDGLGSVRIQWMPALDSGSGVKLYRVYRYQNQNSAPVLVDTVSAPTTSSVVAQSGDLARKYTQLYAVTAEDNDGNVSGFSIAASPDPHGAYSQGLSVDGCTLCHQVHGAASLPDGTPIGALGAKTAAACYECHGNTPGNNAYGFASTLDSQGLLGEDGAIASDGPDQPGGNTVHRNAAMSTGQRECDACHSPHRRPYNETVAGAYDPATSYGRLLKGNTAKTTEAYSTDAATFGNDFCFGCHGAGVMTYMNDIGGAQAFDDSGGDHETGFSAGAHAATTVLPTAGTGGKVQANCVACHNEHASPNNGLTDYRQTNTTAATYNQAGLCFACHSATSTEGAKSVGTAPFTWWGTARGDVKAEFARSGGTNSKHPYAVPAGGPVAEAGSWSQTLQSDFSSADTFTRTIAAADDSIELQPISGDDGTLWSDGFESGGFAAWDGDPTYWATTTADSYAGTTSARGTTNVNGTRRTDYLLKTVSLTGRTTIRLNYAWRTNFTGGTDYFRAEYYSGGVWTQLFNTTTTGASAWTTRSDTVPATATQIRFTSSVNATGEYCAVDAVSVTADPEPYTYENVGSAVTPIISATGTLDSWTDLTFHGAQPAGSTMRVDVLRGTDDYEIPGLQDLPIIAGSYSLAGLPKISYPTLKLRVEMTGNAAVPPSVSDAFTHTTYAASNFDTTKWTDYRLNNSGDPDAPAMSTITVFNDDGTTLNNFPTRAGDWTNSFTWGNPANSIRGGAQSGTTAGTNPDTADTAAFDTTGMTNITVTYDAERAALDAGEYMRIYYNVGSGWVDSGWANSQGNGTTTQYLNQSFTIPTASANTQLRLEVNGADAGEYGYWDNITVTGQVSVAFSSDGSTLTDFPTRTGDWFSSATWGNPANSIRGGAQSGTTAGTNPDTADTAAFDTTGMTNITVTYDAERAALDTGEYMRIYYNVGSGWVDSGWANSQGNGTTTQYLNQSFTIPTASANTQLRLEVVGADAGEYGYWDNIAVTGQKSPTDLWPHEENGTLQLRAEGPAFGATTGVDEGEFGYINPSQGAWISTDDFDLQVNLAAINNAAGGTINAGLMIRTASSEANALQTGAAMAGVYVTNTNVVFEYRATAGAATTAGGNTAGGAPEWLRLERRGDVVTAKSSADGNTWTTVGSGTITGMDTSCVLVGVALTSGVDGSFSEATWDEFSVSGVPQASTVTPSLDDWTIAYQHFPPELAGKLTCVNCHNVHTVQKGTAGVAWNTARVSDPDDITVAAPANVNDFCLRCHDGTPPTKTINQTVTVPYTPVFTGVTSPFFPQWNKTLANVDWGSSGHATSRVTNMTPGCQNCHDPHASTQRRLTALTAFNPAGNPAAHINAKRDNTATYAEEKLCYGCHLANRTVSAQTCTGAAGCHPNLDTQTDAYLNVETAFTYTYKHPVATSGRHEDTEDSAGVSSSNRHAECVDCHDPHATKPGRHADNSSTGGQVLRGATGVKPISWPAETASPFQSAFDAWNLGPTGYTTVRFDGETADYEAYLCFKCHSSYTTQAASVTRNAQTYKPTDVARDFNPNNQSGHNVLGRVWPKTSFNINGTTATWTLPTGTWFKTGYSASSMLTCTNCHEGQGTAAGPHGSSVAYLIDSAYPTAWNSTAADFTGSNRDVSATLICAKCHTGLASINTAHSEHNDRGNEGGYCRLCHVGVPHGWKRPRLIGYTTDPDPYATWRSSSGQTATGNYGMTRISVKSYSPSNWSENDCGAGCDSGRHPLTGSTWP